MKRRVFVLSSVHVRIFPEYVLRAPKIFALPFCLRKTEENSHPTFFRGNYRSTLPFVPYRIHSFCFAVEQKASMNLDTYRQFCTGKYFYPLGRFTALRPRTISHLYLSLGRARASNIPLGPPPCPLKQNCSEFFKSVNQSNSRLLRSFAGNHRLLSTFSLRH